MGFITTTTLNTNTTTPTTTILIFYVRHSFLLLLLLLFLLHHLLLLPLPQSSVDLGSQTQSPSIPDGLWTSSCRFIILFIFQSSSSSSFHLLRGLPISFVSSILTVAICFGILQFCLLSTTSYRIGGIL